MKKLSRDFLFKQIIISMTASCLAIAGVNATDSTNADNSANNQRDKSGETLTPTDQSSSSGDIKITRQIRKKIIKDEGLSTMAKNIKVITISGKVILRGPVSSEAEKGTIYKYAQKVAGAANVDNQLEVKTSK